MDSVKRVAITLRILVSGISVKRSAGLTRGARGFAKDVEADTKVSFHELTGTQINQTPTDGFGLRRVAVYVNL